MQWTVSVTPTNISVMTWKGDNYGTISVASASYVPGSGYWWLERVKVAPTLQREGIGTQLLSRLKKAVAKTEHPKIVVCPGGYGSDPAQLRKFYESCAFKVTASSEYDFEMEWSPL